MSNRNKAGYARFLVRLLQIEGYANNTPYDPQRHIELMLLRAEDLDLIDAFIADYQIKEDAEKRRISKIISLRYGFEGKRQTFDNIGRRLSKPITGSRVLQIHDYTMQELITQSGIKILLPVIQKLTEAGLDSRITKLAQGNMQLQQLLDKQGEFHGTFLTDCFPNCTPDNPCPTCRAMSLLKKTEVLHQVVLLSNEYDQGPGIDWRSYPIRKVGLSRRTVNCLRYDGIHTLGQLCRRTERQLMARPNFGLKSLNEIKEFLTSIGKQLRSE